MKLLPLLALVVCTAYAAPVSDETILLARGLDLEVAIDNADEISLEANFMAMYDLRTIIERWVKGDIGLFKGLKALADVIQGKRDVSDVVDSIKEIFGATSTMGRGLCILLKNVGVHAFTTFVNKILGRDRLVPVNSRQAASMSKIVYAH